MDGAVELRPRFHALFAEHRANQLISISGPGQYDGCCGDTTTHFSLWLHESPGLSGWVDVLNWSYKPDTPLLLSLLAGLPLSLGGEKAIDGIALTSSPPGVPLFTDPNFINPITVTSACNFNTDSRWGDHDCTKTKTPTVFNFDCISCVPITGAGDPRATPLPAAAWLFGSVVAGGAGIGRWRRKRKTARTAKNAAA